MLRNQWIILLLAGGWLAAGTRAPALDYTDVETRELLANPQKYWATGVVFQDELVERPGRHKLRIGNSTSYRFGTRILGQCYAQESLLPRLSVLDLNKSYYFSGSVLQLGRRYYVVVQDLRDALDAKVSVEDKLLNLVNPAVQSPQGPVADHLATLLTEAEKALFAYAKEHNLSEQSILDPESDSFQKSLDVVRGVLARAEQRMGTTSREILVKLLVDVLERSDGTGGEKTASPAAAPDDKPKPRMPALDIRLPTLPAPEAAGEPESRNVRAAGKIARSPAPDAPIEAIDLANSTAVLASAESGAAPAEVAPEPAPFSLDFLDEIVDSPAPAPEEPGLSPAEAPVEDSPDPAKVSEAPASADAPTLEQESPAVTEESPAVADEPPPAEEPPAAEMETPAEAPAQDFSLDFLDDFSETPAPDSVAEEPPAPVEPGPEPIESPAADTEPSSPPIVDFVEPKTLPEAAKISTEPKSAAKPAPPAEKIQLPTLKATPVVPRHTDAGTSPESVLPATQIRSSEPKATRPPEKQKKKADDAPLTPVPVEEDYNTPVGW
jgi:hypothetical protein